MLHVTGYTIKKPHRDHSMGLNLTKQGDMKP